MKVKFLMQPAIFLEPEKILVIADLHIGIEHEILKSGISIPSQIEDIRKRIDILIKQTKAKHLIILGDLKHQVPTPTSQEMFDISNLISTLSKKVKISIVKGNHDGGIEKILNKDIDVYSSDGFRIKNIGFAHGNVWFNEDLLKAEYVITAHIHPVVEFWSSGYRLTEHCWVRSEPNIEKIEKKYKKKSKIKEFIIMPVFNTMLGGAPINSKEFRLTGPIIKNKIIKWNKSKIYLLDGTYLGNLNHLYCTSFTKC